MEKRGLSRRIVKKADWVEEGGGRSQMKVIISRNPYK